MSQSTSVSPTCDRAAAEMARPAASSAISRVPPPAQASERATATVCAA